MRADVRIPGQDAPEWEVEEKRDGDRTWITLLRMGWVVAEAYLGGYGWRCSTRPREEIPAEVWAAIPAGAADAIRRRL